MITLEKEQEIQNLIDFAVDSVAVGDNEVAEEFLSDAAYIINTEIDNQEEREKYAQKLEINPLDFAK